MANALKNPKYLFVKKKILKLMQETDQNTYLTKIKFWSEENNAY
jgi:hypothetical protein